MGIRDPGREKGREKTSSEKKPSFFNLKGRKRVTHRVGRSLPGTAKSVYPKLRRERSGGDSWTDKLNPR